MERRLAAILAADVVGYSRLMGEDEAGTLTSLKALRKELFAPKVGEHHGRIVKLMGDGALVEFASVVDAVRCAVDIQEAMSERNADVPKGRDIQLRIGINLGDVIVEGDDIYGDGVNVAARLEELAEPGQVYVSGKVHDELRGKLELGFDDLGAQLVKNIAEPVRVYRVTAGQLASSVAPSSKPLPLPDKPSIAVLPFDNMSGDPEQEYFADGITEEIITALARLPGFLVIARNSTFIYKGKRVEVRRVAGELGVRYVVEGSVRTSGGKVRITAQLIDASTGNHLWAETFDGDLEDVFAVQDEVTHKIVNSIGSELTLAETERLKSQPPQDLVSWQCVMQSLAHFYQFTKEGIAKSAEMARKAVALDDQNAEGHALLAIVLWAQAVAGFVRPAAQAMAEATNAAERGIALNERSARAHAAMGLTLITQFRYDEALAESERAVELEPGSAEILTWSGFVLAYTGPYELADERLRHAVRLNPRDPGMYSRYQALSIVSFALGHYEESLESANRVARQLPEWHGARTFMLASLGQLGRTEEAGPVLQETLLRWPHFTVKYAARRHPYRDMEARERLAEGLRRAGVPD